MGIHSMLSENVLLSLRKSEGTFNLSRTTLSDMTNGDSTSRVRSLAGEWHFRPDPDDIGIDEEWYASGCDDILTLPGTTDENGVGDPNPAREPDHLTRTHPFEGVAWYQREVTIPKSWAGDRIVLTLERTRSTRVWVDEHEIGGNDALSTPQTYDLSDALESGEHTITIRVDNDAAVLNLPGVQRSHMVTEHTQTNWNGIIGDITLVATSPVWIDDIRTFPDPEAGSVTAEVIVGNLTPETVTGQIELSARTQNSTETRRHDPVVADFETNRATDERQEASVAERAHGSRTAVEIEYDLGEQPLRWDEFSPAYYQLTASVDAVVDDQRVEHETTVDFGMGTFEIEGTQFEANDRTIFLRGNVDCCIFPKTGYPPMTTDEWREFLGTAAEYGINHYRFHSWCPPEAAFEAADELGLYLQPELPIWNAENAFEEEDAIEFFQDEAERILDAYGNHPSFVMFSLGNELDGSQENMSELLEHLRAYDPRQLYSCGSYNFLSDSTLVDADEYWTTASVPPNPTDADSGRLMVRGAGLDDHPPATTRDYSEAIEDIPIPIISHEIGQYQVYPDFEEIEMYDGVLRARNLELARDHLEAHGMLDRSTEFRHTSGALAVQCYREEIEAALRTPGFGGFQLLDLQDFPGQGTALVGILDSFMNSKGLIEPDAWREFCSPTVPLVRMKTRTWTGMFEADAAVAHYGPAALDTVTPRWTLTDAEGETVDSGSLATTDIPQGTVIDLGTIRTTLAVEEPTKLSLELTLDVTTETATDAANAYDLWVYPDDLPALREFSDQADNVTDAFAVTSDADDFYLCRSFDERARDRLAAGDDVLLIPRHDELRHSVEGTFQPDFWSYAMFKRRAPPGTMGLTCDPDHPLFESFPTDDYSDWQWWHLLINARPIVLDDAPRSYRPIVGMVDNIERNQKLGMVFETAVGDGTLLVCAIDLFACEDDPSVRQFASSLVTYATSEAFDPSTNLPKATLEKLLSR